MFAILIQVSVATPILDLEAPPPNPPRLWLARFIGFFIGIAIVVLVILADQHVLPDWHWPRFNGLLLLPALYIVVAIHEVGHLLAGYCVGMKPGGVTIGPFSFSKSGHRWRFRFNGRAGIGGFFKPLTADEKFDPVRYACMIAGGPLATLAGALLFWHFANGTWDWIGTSFWASAFILLISLIPYSGKVNKSDGARLWQIIRHPDRAEIFAARLSIQTQDAKGVRPRDWDAQTFDKLLSSEPKESGYLGCQLMAYYRRIDEAADETALHHLENTLAASERTSRPILCAVFNEAAFASAHYRKRSAQARTWLDRVRQMNKKQPLHVSEAAIAMCEERYEDALRHWAAARALVDKRKLDSGLIRFAKEKWAEHEQVCRQAIESAAKLQVS